MSPKERVGSHVLLGAVLLALPAAEQPTQPRELFARGQALLRAGDAAAAREQFAQAVRLIPDWGLAHLHLGLAEQLLDPKSGRARDALQRAAALDERNPRAHYHLALAYEQLGDHAAAVTHLKRALELRRGLADADFRLAQNLRALGQVEAALAAHQEVLLRDPAHVGSLSALAELYEELGRFEEAEDALVRITRRHPNVAYHYYTLARFYERHRRPVKAKQAHADAEALEPRAERRMRRLK